MEEEEELPGAGLSGTTGDLKSPLAVSINWGSLLWVSL